MLFSAFPEPQGLYDPQNESDSCGVAMIADIHGRRSHAIVADGLVALEHLEHRGAAGAEPNSGDGAGILIQLPVELLEQVVHFELPPPAADGTNTFAAGICFLPQAPAARTTATEEIEAIAKDEGLQVLGWREVPVDPAGAEVGETALGCMPYMSQLFVTAPGLSGIGLDRHAYPLRKRAERTGVYFPSLSSRTMV
jgi:glutamate synthase (NADPH/NADH) large chain/glutamate synthase (ferredoxin)